MSDDDIVAKFRTGVTNVAAISLAIGYPTVASLPHSVVRGYRNVLAIALATNFSFPRADKIKEILADPSKFAAAAAPAAAPAKEQKKEEPKKEAAKKKEEPPPEEEDLGFGLFD